MSTKHQLHALSSKWKTMKTYIYLCALAILALVYSACSKENDSEIHQELEVYFNAFVTEAQSYGKEISLSDIDISGYVENIEERETQQRG